MIRVYRYISVTADWGILYSFKEKDVLRLVVYSDVDWVGDSDSRRSIFSYVIILAGGVIFWSSRK